MLVKKRYCPTICLVGEEWNIHWSSISEALCSLGVLWWFLWTTPQDNFNTVIFVDKAAWDKRNSSDPGCRWARFQPCLLRRICATSNNLCVLPEPQPPTCHDELCSSGTPSRADTANPSCTLGFENTFTTLCSCSVHSREVLGSSCNTHMSSCAWQTAHELGPCDTLLIPGCAVCFCVKSSVWCLSKRSFLYVEVQW